MLCLQVVVQGWHGEPGVAPDLDGDLRPAGTEEPNQPFEDGQRTAAGMTGPGTQDGRDELAGVAIEDQERVIHVLAVEAVVGDPFLLAMRGIIGAIQIEDDVRWDPVALPLLEIELHQRHGEPVAGFDVDGILQPGEGGLTRQISPVRTAATDQLQEWIRAEGIGIILVLIATGDLEDTLTDQSLQGMPDGAMAPFRNLLGKGGTEVEGGIGLREPAETAVGGELRTVEGRDELGGGQAEVDRLGHEASPGEAWFVASAYPVFRDASSSFTPFVNKKG